MRQDAYLSGYGGARGRSCAVARDLGRAGAGIAGSMERLHPWAKPAAIAVVLCSAAMALGCVLMAMHVRAGGWVALVATVLLCVVAAPLFTLASLARNPDQPRR